MKDTSRITAAVCAAVLFVSLFGCTSRKIAGGESIPDEDAQLTVTSATSRMTDSEGKTISTDAITSVTDDTISGSGTTTSGTVATTSVHGNTEPHTNSNNTSDTTTDKTAAPDASAETTAFLNTVDFMALSSTAINDMYRLFWTNQNGGHICGDSQDGNGNTSMIWESTMLVLAMENYYVATGDTTAKDKIRAQWQYIRSVYDNRSITGNMGYAPNSAADDAGWTAMFLMTVYHVLGDKEALSMARTVILNAYSYWKDGSLSNGMWYCDTELYNGDQWKSIYSASLVISALEYCENTKGTSQYDAGLYDKTMTLYNWLEENMRRDAIKTYNDGLQDGSSYTVTTIDYLYWSDFNVNRSNRCEKNGPDGGVRPKDIAYTGSVSALFGNMGMAAINAKLYKITGDQTYLTKAVQTAQALTRVYDNNGAYLNDRDHNTNSAFTYYYIKEVLTLAELSAADRNMMGMTAYYIATYGRTGSGYYNTSWGKGGTSLDGEIEKLTCNATNVNMITAAALCRSLGLF